LTRQVIASHHERWDGSGYPRGLRGAEIPVAARIFAVVDAYDAMTNDQPYRAALSADEAVEELRTRAGLDFDPDIVGAFLELGPPEPQRLMP
jgi:HD-GYP domain-containing protein (c-di-GMP phosphodiesterase class II)